MLIKEIIKFLEQRAPRYLQESYDNAGLIVGDPSVECNGVLICLDSIESVVEEAIQKKCNLIVAHHPILFSGIKSLTGRNYIERTIIKAIKHDIAIYAIHTNLDNVSEGVNRMISQRLELTDTRILDAKKGHLSKIVVFCPHDHATAVRSAMFEAGAGHIGDYDSCSFNLQGSGSFRGSESSSPFVGKKGELHVEPETRIETVAHSAAVSSILKAVAQVHPYEEIAYDVYPLNNAQSNLGAGMIGRLEKPMGKEVFLAHLKSKLQTGTIRFTPFVKDTIETVAVCGGSGSFLLSKAMQSGADVLVTSDFKYHQFFDADGSITICDIGHYESEQFTITLLGDWLKEKFPKFAVHLTEINTNPVNYY